MNMTGGQSALFEVEPVLPRTERKRRARDRSEARIQIVPHQTVPYELNHVYQVDCVEAMRRLPNASVDIAIADPPYNASKGNNWKWDNSVSLPGFGGKWSKVMADWDDMPLADYFAFTLSWIAEMKRVVRPTGSLWIHGTYHNIGIINFALQILSVEIINEVVWYKRNSFPNLSGRRLTASHETILWAHTGGDKKRRYYFNYDASRDMWSPEDLLKTQGKQMRTVWDVPNNKEREELAYGKHPTQKPVRLLKRMLKISARPGDLLLVPFAGSGSDCVAAHELGINFVGFETDAEYVRISNDRVRNSNTDTLLGLDRCSGL
jgi:DNA modification methylase